MSPFNKWYNKKPSKLRSKAKTVTTKTTLYKAPTLSFKSGTIHKYTRNLLYSTLAETGVPIEQTFQFSLDQLPAYSEFTNLYDSYRIDKVRVTFEPFSNINSWAHYCPMIRVIKDYNDNNALGSASSYYQDETMRSYPFLKRFSVVVYPKTSTAVYDGLLSAYTETKGKPWIHMANNDVPHYGLKVYFGNSGAANGTYLYNVFIKYYISCKSVH